MVKLFDHSPVGKRLECFQFHSYLEHASLVINANVSLGNISKTQIHWDMRYGLFRFLLAGGQNRYLSTPSAYSLYYQTLKFLPT